MIRNSDAERLVDKDVAGVRQKVEMAKEIAEGRSAFRSLVAMSVKYEKASKVDPLFDFVQSNIKQRRLEKNRVKKVSNLQGVSGFVRLLTPPLTLDRVAQS